MPASLIGRRRAAWWTSRESRLARDSRAASPFVDLPGTPGHVRPEGGECFSGGGIPVEP